jgi:hypothetical protein
MQKKDTNILFKHGVTQNNRLTKESKFAKIACISGQRKISVFLEFTFRPGFTLELQSGHFSPSTMYFGINCMSASVYKVCFHTQAFLL